MMPASAWLAAIVSMMGAACSVFCAFQCARMVNEAREIEQRRLKLLVRKEMRHRK